MKFFLLFAIFVSHQFCCQTALEKFNNEHRNYKLEDINEVSIINLISTPEKYDGKLVSVKGFLIVAFENTVLFLHKEDLENGISKNGIWVNILRTDLNNLKLECDYKYARIVGTFNARSKGHMGAYSGSIVNIQLISPNK